MALLKKLAETLKRRASRADKPSEPDPEIIVHDGAAVLGRETLPPGGELAVGRAPDNHVVLEEDGVSRYHLKLTRRRGRCRVEDLDSRNGTWVNDNRLDPGRPQPLEHGDIISVDSFTLLVVDRRTLLGRRKAVQQIDFDRAEVEKEVERLVGELPGLRNVRRASGSS